MTPDASRKIAYPSNRSLIWNGDLLLFRPATRIGRLIARAGRSEYCHVGTAVWARSQLLGTAVWARSQLLCCDTRATGGRRVRLSRLVEAYPGAIDLYRPLYTGSEEAAHAKREWVADWVFRHAEGLYGWGSILKMSLLHAPVLRWLIDAHEYRDDVEAGTMQPVCSELRSIADRLAGDDPVPNLADRLTEPGDLARSTLYRYLGTLVA